MRVILTDDSVFDSQGQRVMVAGMDTTRFNKHGVLLFGHKDGELPIGQVIDIRKEGTKLTGEVVFDEDDDFAMKVKGKAEKGLVAYSIGYLEHEVSEDPAMKLPNQSSNTVTKSELFELSVVSIPSNPNALKELQAKAAMKLKYSVKSNSNSNSNEMELVKKHFQLPTTATEAEVMGKVAELEKKTADAEMKLELMEAKAAKEKADNLVGGAVSAGKITKKQAAVFSRFAMNDFEGTKVVLDGMKGYQSIKGQLGTGDGLAEKMADRKDWSFLDWQKKDSVGLKAMRTNDPTGYGILSKTLKAGN